MDHHKKLLAGSAAVLGFAAIVSSAQAATIFDNATADIAFLKSPKVTLSTTSSTAMFSGTTAVFSTTGELGNDLAGSGTANGTLKFSNVDGTTVAESLPSFLTLTDAEGTFKYDVTSVETTSYIVSPGTTAVSLYVLGNVSGGIAGYLPGPTSFTLQINKTGKSGYSAAGSLAAPPNGVPEPMSWALMLAGFGLSGVMLRRSRAQVAA